MFFGWQSTTPAVSADRETYATGAINNLVGYSNKTVDGLFDKLVLTSDQAEQVKIQTQIEKELFKDAIGHPDLPVPVREHRQQTRITDVDPAILAPTMFYGFWNWKVPSAS